MPPSNNAEKPSSSWSYESLMNWWKDLHDEQRLERLQQCRQIEQVLKECQQKQNHRAQEKVSFWKKSKKADTQPDASDADNQIESIVPGLRMMKYFGWRGINSHADDGDDQQVQDISSSCAREQHALWACRAVSIGCGNDLSRLKKCFDSDTNQDGNDHDHEEGGRRRIPKVLQNPSIAYEPKSQRDIDEATCGDLQAILGKCVGQGAQELYERTKKDSSSAKNRK